MTNTIKTLVLAAVIGSTTITEAAPMISGTVDFFGLAKLNGTPATATGVATFGPTFVASTTGDFSTIATFGQAVVFPPTWTFVSGPIASFWSVPAAGLSFDLTSSSVDTQTAVTLGVSGPGILHAAGYADTPGIFYFSRQSGQVEASFSATTIATPDGGTTLSLLGIGFLGLAGLRRTFNV